MTILDGILFLPAVHFTKGREAKVDTIVLHWMATTLAGCDATFTSGRREASAHFGIEGAKIHQYVRQYDTAWHSGDRPTNHRSIGIEHSAQPGRDATPITIATSVALCVYLCRKYEISPDRIFPHKKFTATACPGTLPIAEIVARVRAELNSQAASPFPTITTTDTEDELMALTLTNPLTKADASVATGLNSTWFYGVASFQLLKELAAKSGVVVDVDESAIAAQVLAGLIGPLKAAVTAAVAAGGSVDQITDTVVARLATAIQGA